MNMKSVLFLVTALAFTTVQADEGKVGPSQGQVYLAPGLAYHEGSDDFDLDDVESDIGGILGFQFTDRWGLEFRGASIDHDDGEIELRSLDALYQFAEQGRWQPFVVFGVGENKYESDLLNDSEKSREGNVGIGTFLQLSKHIALRADIRAAGGGELDGVVPSGFVGLTALLGEGRAPEPPADSDGDGVPNDQDKCPTTPAGRVVDANGCQLDSDGDGVVDADDRCPETPAGVAVDSRGCALDTDGDGVPDYRDDCPDTAAGALVNERGCYIELEEAVTIDMNLEFDVDKAEILPKHRSEINRVVTFLRQYPTANAVIEGHTDSSGSRAYNQGLSERRAKAVHDYLVSNANVDSGRLSHAGFGEDRPIADNETAEGKQKNRRVSAVVEGTHTVRKTKED